MSSINLCAVVAASTMDEVVRQIKECTNNAQYIEVRSDYLNNQSDIDLSLLQNCTNQKLIITCRRSDEGGKWRESEEARLNILQQAFDCGFLVDVELRTLEEGIFKLHSDKAKRTIISFHDFTSTPTLHSLEEVLHRMERFDPGIKKIATMITSDKDRRILLQLLINKKEAEKLTVIGMGEGEKGMRLLSPLLGGAMTYCAIDNKGQTAPGQISCKQMLELYKLLD